MMKRLKYMWELHKFFVDTSKSFMQGTSRVRYYLYYPIAYFKFMWYSYKDFIPKTKK